jgi:hypothetical protein
MNVTSVDESEEKYPPTLYLYLEQLFYLACSSNHFYGDGLSLKLLNLHSKLFKDCALWPNASLKLWLGPQIAWFVPQLDLACTPSYTKIVSFASRYRHRLATTS